MHSQQAAHQGIEFGQFDFCCQRSHLLDPGPVDRGLHLRIVHQFELVKMQIHPRPRIGSLWARRVGKGLQQRLRKALAQNGFATAQQTGRLNQRIALLQVANFRLLALQGQARGGHQLAHQDRAARRCFLQGGPVQFLSGHGGPGGHG